MRTSNGATLQGDRVLTIPTSVMDVRLEKTTCHLRDKRFLSMEGVAWPTAQPCRPRFFVIGAPKCGTTSLHDYIAQHPQVG